jgi:hypothetical protein
MKLHRLKDSKGMKSREELYRLKMERRRKEELFIERVNILRGGMVRVRGDNGDSSRSPIKCFQLPAASRRYMTKLPPLNRSRSTSANITSIDEFIGESTDGEPVTTSDLVDEYELKCLLSENIEDEDCSSNMIEAHFDGLKLKISQTDLESSCGNDYDALDDTPDGEARMASEADNDMTVLDSSTNSATPAPYLPLGPYAIRRRDSSDGTTHKVKEEPEKSLSRDKKAILDERIKDKALTPPWLGVPQLTMLSESVQSNMKIYFEVVSKVDSIDISSPKFILDKYVFRIGTLGSCDYSLKCHDNGGDIRQIRRVSRIHCLVYVPLVLQQYSRYHHGMSPRNYHTSANDGHKADNLSSTNNIGMGGEEYEDTVSHKHVTIVDNHSTWGTYVVSVNGVRKVPTTIQKALPLVPGDLVCIGVVRNGPQTMSPIDANKALVVFRVRIE